MAGSSLNAGGCPAHNTKMDMVTNPQGELGGNCNNGLKRSGGSRIAIGSEFFECVDSSTRTQREDEGRNLGSPVEPTLIFNSTSSGQTHYLIVIHDKRLRERRGKYSGPRQ
jgi:hypothetical protein